MCSTPHTSRRVCRKHTRTATRQLASCAYSTEKDAGSSSPHAGAAHQRTEGHSVQQLRCHTFSAAAAPHGHTVVPRTQQQQPPRAAAAITPASPAPAKPAMEAAGLVYIDDRTASTAVIVPALHAHIKACLSGHTTQLQLYLPARTIHPPQHYAMPYSKTVLSSPAPLLTYTHGYTHPMHSMYSSKEHQTCCRCPTQSPLMFQGEQQHGTAEVQRVRCYSANTCLLISPADPSAPTGQCL